MRGTNHKLWQQESFYKQNTTHNNCADAWVTNTKHLVWTSSVYKTNPTTYRSSYCARHTHSMRDTKAHKIWKQTKTVSVPFCLSVRISPEPHVPSLPIFCACRLWPLLSPPLAGWQNPKGKGGNFGGFLWHWQCTVQHSIQDPYKKPAEPIDTTFRMIIGLGPRNSVTWGWWSPKGSGNFDRKHVPDKPNTPNNCEVDWSMQQHTTGADAWLQALDESINGREVGMTSGFVDDIVFFSTVSHIEVWITLRSTDFTYIYLFIINLDRIWFNITKWHNVV